MQLARFLTDLEPGHSQKADILFAGRFDVKHDQATLAHVSRSFNVCPFLSRRQGAVGWPHGCNELWFDTMSYIQERIKAKVWPQYKAILTIEGDCVPLKRDWVDRLHALWDNERPPMAFCTGALLSAPAEHINGNSLWSASPDDLEFVRRIGGANPGMGWDYQHAGKFKNRGWHTTDKIISYWNMQTCDRQTFENLMATDAALFHGCKDLSLLSMARAKMLGQRGLGYEIRPPQGTRMRVKW